MAGYETNIFNIIPDLWKTFGNNPRNQETFDALANVNPVMSAYRGGKTLINMDFSPIKQAYLNEAYGISNPLVNKQAGQTLASTVGAVADLIPVTPVAKAGTKALGKEVARQIESGTGVIGKNIVDPRQYMFVGEKGINNLGLQDVLSEANKMKASKVPDEKIWSETAKMVADKGVRGGGITFRFDNEPHLEISDDLAKVNPMPKTDFNFAPLPSILEHPDLYKAEPSLKSLAIQPQNIDYSFANSRDNLIGIGTPHRTTTSYNDDLGNLIEEYNFNPDVVGHEVNHIIQRRHELPQGGNQYTQDVLNKLFQEQSKNYNENFTNIAQQQPKLDNLYRTKRIQDFLYDLNKPSYKPRDLYGRGDWYKYSDDIRRELGAMPKKAGDIRDNYIRNAKQILFDKYKQENSISQQDVNEVINLGKTRQQTDYQIKKIWKKLEPDYKAQREFSELKYKNYEMNKLKPNQVYDRLTGEATSRLVQDRWNMTPEQRGLLYPVPKSESGKELKDWELYNIYYD